jgi:DNA invertase Pin-like site-specific DNA recombinase
MYPMASRNDSLETELRQFEREVSGAARMLLRAQEGSRALRADHRSGRPYRDLLRPARRPLDGVQHVIDRLRPAASRLRRAEMAALRAEGATTVEIARRYGVTHQRVSRILARPRLDT